MNILQLASNMKRNGPAMVVYNLSRGLAEMGHNVYIASGEGELAKEINHPNIHFVHIPIDRVSGHKIKQASLYIINAFVTYVQLKRLIQAEHIDIINSHQPISNLYAKRLSTSMKIPFVTTSHNVYSKGRLSDTYVSGDHVIACSEKVYENSIRNFHISEDRITCIRNGIDPERLIPADPILYSGKFTIGTLAGLRKQKALDKLIAAFAMFHKKVPESVLVIAGNGEEEQKLRKFAKEMEVESAVEFLGFRNDAPNIFAGLNVFALSSEYEGLPISMLEAMSMKLPVVVTSVGGIPWVIEDELNGLLCDYGDTEQMADCFYRLYENRDYSNAIAEAGYQTIIRDFSYKKMAVEYGRVYEKLISQRILRV